MHWSTLIPARARITGTGVHARLRRKNHRQAQFYCAANEDCLGKDSCSVTLRTIEERNSPPDMKTFLTSRVQRLHRSHIGHGQVEGKSDESEQLGYMLVFESGGKHLFDFVLSENALGDIKVANQKICESHTGTNDGQRNFLPRVHSHKEFFGMCKEVLACACCVISFRFSRAITNCC